jgi:PAS domain S-box-containing protein
MPQIATQPVIGPEMLQALLDAAISPIITVDTFGIIQNLNNATQLLFGYTQDELIGSNIKMLMPEPFRSNHDGYMQHYLSTGIAKIIGRGRDVHGQRKDGTIFPMHLEIGKFELRNSIFFVGIIRDITAEHQQQKAIEKAQRMEAVGQLTGGMAHDFNNLLAVISGNLEMLQMRLADSRQLALANQIVEATDMGKRLTQRLLTFARRGHLEPQIINVNDQVRSLAELLRRTLGEQVTLTTRLSPDLWHTLADPSMIENAIINLAINARDAMPSGGNLFLETNNISIQTGSSMLAADLALGEYVCLCLTDAGVGMSQEALQRAFEPFFTTKGGQGTGLGLSTVYGQVKQSGGNVTICSQIGQGTSVSIYLPRSEQKMTKLPKEPLDNRKNIRGKGQTILVVEDNAQVRTVSTARLRDLGYHVVEADSGAAAITMLRLNPAIQLVFTDIVMSGGISGYDLAGWVLEHVPNVKILLTSAYPADPNAEQTKVLRTLKILSKPHSQRDLALAICAQLYS